jgi:hypothetical protein
LRRKPQKCFVYYAADIKTPQELDEAAQCGVPPLTPGTNQKMSQAILDTFKSFEKEQKRLGIPKGLLLNSLTKSQLEFFTTNLQL